MQIDAHLVAESIIMHARYSSHLYYSNMTKIMHLTGVVLPFDQESVHWPWPPHAVG